MAEFLFFSISTVKFRGNLNDRYIFIYTIIYNIYICMCMCLCMFYVYIYVLAHLKSSSSSSSRRLHISPTSMQNKSLSCFLLPLPSDWLNCALLLLTTICCVYFFSLVLLATSLASKYTNNY